MRVLVACEFSGTVRDAFIRRGHDAVSCDLLPTEAPGPHIQDTIESVLATIGGTFDLMIAHPPCTFLASSGLHWNKRVPGRQFKTEEAVSFVRLLLESGIGKIALENPIGCLSSKIRKPDQIIQPWMFGHDASKATCLWLTNLPKLAPTDHHPGRYACKCGLQFDHGLGKYGCPNLCNKPARVIYANQTPSGQNNLGPSKDRWKLRSVTYKGIAEAMAEQWGN